MRYIEAGCLFVLVTLSTIVSVFVGAVATCFFAAIWGF